MATVAAIVALARLEGKQDESSRERVRVLPPFVVTELREGLPWKYARVGNFEILSLLPSDDLTRRFVSAQIRGTYFIPENLQAAWTTPVQIILFDRQVGGPDSVKVTDADWRFGARWKSFGGTITASDRDTLVLAANLENTREWPRAVTDYAHASYRALTPAAPDWLTDSLIGPRGVYRDIGFYEDRAAFRVPAFLWVSEEETERLASDDKFQPRFLPLGVLFEDSDAVSPLDEADARRRSVQRTLLAHWALFERTKPKEAPRDFWGFAASARREPVTEALFERYFHLSYAAATEAMRVYLRKVIRSGFACDDARLQHTLEDVENLEFRPATELEVARLKGSWERLEARELASRLPDLAAKYQAAAGRSLRRGLRYGGAADPALLNVLGLHEYDIGQFKAAREHLERAAAGDQATSQGLFALACLRLAFIRVEKPAGPLNATQLQSVMTPLLEARTRSPALVEVYDLMARTLAAGESPPPPDQLAVLMEGVRLFPREPELLCDIAELHLRFGDHAEAAALTDAGLKLVAAGPLRARFASLQSRLADTAQRR